jgi:DNA-binding MarR family transcriptional regulator
MHKMEMPADYALVLQQIQENGQDDIANLSESLHIRRSRLTHIIDALKHKGLVRLTRDYHSDLWVELSGKGQRLVQYLWPESRFQPSY